MHLHFLTLKRQANYLKKNISGAFILNSFTQVKNEWILQLVLPDDNEKFLQLSCHPHFPFVILNDSIKKQKNSTIVMEELQNLKINDLKIVPGERIFRMDFEKSDLRLMIHLFTTNSNSFIVNRDNLIINSFKKSKVFKETTHKIPDSIQTDICSISHSQFLKIVKNKSEISLLPFLKRNFYHLNQTVLNEIFFRLEIPKSASIEKLEDDQLKTIHAEVISLLNQCEKDNPIIYFENKLPDVLSLTHLDHLQNDENEMFEDINSAIRFFNFQSLKYQTLIQKKKVYSKSLKQRIEFLEKTLKNLKEKQDSPEKKEHLQKIGQLILAQPQVIKPGTTSVQLTDYFNPKLSTIQIQIDPDLNAQENAERYFQKAKNFDQKQLKRKQRAKEIQSQLKHLIQIRENLQSIDSNKELEKIETKLKSENLLQKSETEAVQMRLPYKKFIFKDWEIWVGRSARDNDTMTFKHAHKEDWWLHVQGYSGSHVVIRDPHRRKDIPPKVLQYAASLAITHSEAKHASYVPVVYTKVKYVRKPRKSVSGTVIPNQTKTIYADPIQD